VRFSCSAAAKYDSIVNVKECVFNSS